MRSKRPSRAARALSGYVSPGPRPNHVTCPSLGGTLIRTPSRGNEHGQSPSGVTSTPSSNLSLAPGDGARFDHVGITVRDLGRALDFWCGRFGYEVVGDIRHHGDNRGFLMTYLAAGGSVLEVFSFDIPTLAPPAIAPGQLGLRGIGVTAYGAIEEAAGLSGEEAAGLSDEEAAGLSDDPDGVRVEILGDDV